MLLLLIVLTKSNISSITSKVIYQQFVVFQLNVALMRKLWLILYKSLYSFIYIANIILPLGTIVKDS